MPYDSVSALPDNVKKLPAKRQRQWMAVWNSSYKTCMAKPGASAAACESTSFAKANGVANKGAEMADDELIQFDEGWGLQLEKADPRVNYRTAAPGSSRMCGNCRFFDDEAMSCDVVEGTIDANWVSDLWTEQLSSQVADPESDDVLASSGWNEMLSVFVEATKAFDSLKVGEVPANGWIPFLPKPGKYAHPSYGMVNITPAGNEEMVASVKNHVYQEHIPLDAEHETKVSGAVAWITDMRMNSDGSADAYVEWTERGRTLIKGGQFKYVSPEWWDVWKDPASGIVHRNIIAGGAITTRPFFKDKVLRALVANEAGTKLVRPKSTTEGEDPVADDKKKTAAEEEAEAAEAKKAAEAAEAKKAEDAKVAAAKKASEEADAEAAKVAAAKKAAEEADAPKLMSAAEVQAKLDEQAKTFNDKLTASENKVAALEKKDRTNRFTEIISGKGGSTDGARWAGEPAKHMTILEALAEKFGETDPTFVAYVEQQNAIAAQVAEGSLYAELGARSGPGASDPERQIEALVAAEMAKDSKKNHSQAYAEVMETSAGKKLYDEIPSPR